MKKLLLTGVALVGFACGVFAQGSFVLDNSASNNGVASDTPGNYYTGTYGLEVWEANNTTPSLATSINTAASTSGVNAYNMLAANGFTLEATYASQNMTTIGAIQVGAVKMADVSPAGSAVTVALAVWNNSQGTWAGMLANSSALTRAGVNAFAQTTANYNAVPPPVPPGTAGFSSADLVMLPVPEPSTFALAGLGAAALLIFRRRK